jgi:hypothetical protein
MREITSKRLDIAALDERHFYLPQIGVKSEEKD